MIDITLIGTGAMLPIPGRALSSAVLKCGGRTILFDCGEGTQTAARKAGVSLIKAEMIAVTHYHGDHIFGLPGLLQTMNNGERKEPLTIAGPSGIKEELAPVLKLAGRLGFYVNLTELNNDPIDLEKYGFPHGAVLTPFKTKHRVTSIGYVFTLSRAGKFDPEKAKALNIPVKQWSVLQKGEETLNEESVIIKPGQVLGEERKGLKVVFSGDTMACGSLTSASKDADLLICDGTYGESGQDDLAAEHGHCTFEKAAETAKEAGAKLLWLTHFSQMMTDPEEFIANAAAVFPCTECGKDGKKITLVFE